MTDEQISEITRTISDARVLVAALNKQANDLAAALGEFRVHQRNEALLRQREASVLAREDRATIREREVEEALKRLEKA